MVTVTFAVVFFCVGAVLVRDATGMASIRWINALKVDRIETFRDIGRYLLELRTGIPPLLSTFELGVLVTTGSTLFVKSLMYKVLLLLGFYVPLAMYSRTVLGHLIAVTFSIVLLWGTVHIHALIPMVYDALTPLWVLLLLIAIRRTRLASRWRVAMGSLTGFLLAFLELLRPFVLPLLPLLLLYTIFQWRHLPRRALISFGFVFLLLSGGWHLKVFALHQGQVLWSNYTGFNLSRAWLPEADRTLPPIKKPDGLWNRANNRETYSKSLELREQVVEEVLSQPTRSIQRALQRIRLFASPQVTAYFKPAPDHWIVPVYVFAVRLLLFMMLARIVFLIPRFWKCKRFKIFLGEKSFLLILTSILFLVLAVGEAREEFRLILTVLPLFIALIEFDQVGWNRWNRKT